jgi:hypothetical protein
VELAWVLAITRESALLLHQKGRPRFGLNFGASRGRGDGFKQLQTAANWTNLARLLLEMATVFKERVATRGFMRQVDSLRARDFVLFDEAFHSKIVVGCEFTFPFKVHYVISSRLGIAKIIGITAVVDVGNDVGEGDHRVS